jgi:hypothetical protein
MYIDKNFDMLPLLMAGFKEPSVPGRDKHGITTARQRREAFGN